MESLLYGADFSYFESSNMNFGQIFIKYFNVIGIVSLYCVISISMVFLNKYLGSSAPLFVTWYQCVVTVAIQAALGEVGKRASPGSFFLQFPPFEYDLKVAWNVMQLSGM